MTTSTPKRKQSAPSEPNTNLDAGDLMLVKGWSVLFDQSLFNAMFWTPRYLKNVPLTHYTPLLFWLTAVIRPAHVRVIGCDDGFAHFAFCQALDKLNLKALCEGVGVWGSRPDGKPDLKVPDPMLAHQELLYEDLSILTSTDNFENAVALFEPIADGILLIDLTVMPPDASFSVELLASKLSGIGVLLIHGTNALPGRGSFGFNLAKFIENSRHIALPNGAGLALIANDATLRFPAIRALFEQNNDNAKPQDFVALLRRVGKGIRAQAEAQEALQKLSKSAREVGVLKSEIASRKEELGQLKSALDEQMRSAAVLQSDLFDSQLILERETAKFSALLADTRNEARTMQADLEVARAQLESEQRARVSEVLLLSDRVAELEEALEVSRSDWSGLAADLEVARAQLESEQRARVSEVLLLSDRVAGLEEALEDRKSVV